MPLGAANPKDGFRGRGGNDRWHRAMSAGCTHMTRECTWRGLRHLGRKACCIGAVVSLATGPRLVRCSARLHYGNRGCSRSTRYVESSRSTRAGGPSLSLWSIATALTPLSRLKTPPTSQQSASLSADSAPLAHQSLKAAVRSWWHWPLDSVLCIIDFLWCRFLCR